MKGLIFNILSELSERAGCQDDAWEVALAGAALGDDEYELERVRGADVGDEDLDDEDVARTASFEEEVEIVVDDALEVEAFEMPYLEGEWGDSFRFLVRSAGPFSERDWAHLPGTPVPLGRTGTERRSEPVSERSSFLPEADGSEPYAALVRTLSGAKR
jgi:hypothetical protein